MTKRFLNIGLIGCIVIIFLQIFAGFYDIMQLKVIYLRYFLDGLNAFSNIVILIILWRILVKVYKQSQLDIILRIIILVSIMTTMLIFLGLLHLGQFVTITLIVLSIIALIFYFIFINRVMEIDRSEIYQIEQLKNYAVAFVICLFGQLILSMVIVFSNRIKGLDFIRHLLILIPIIFIGLFFMKTKYELMKK